MSHKHEMTTRDARRLLSNTARMIRHLERTGEGFAPLCRDHGELMLQDALHYLAWGDTDNARYVMTVYDIWCATGEAPWPYDATKAPPSA